MLNSHTNNLEEQSILGLDCISIVWEEDNNRYTTKKFYSGDLPSISNLGYYILFITEYGSGEIPEFVFQGDSLNLGTYGSSKGKIETLSDGTSVLIADSSDFYVFNSADHALDINPPEEAYFTSPTGDSSNEQMINKQVLCFRPNKLDLSDTQSVTDIVIAMKTVTKSTSNGKIYTKESIVNYLNN